MCFVASSATRVCADDFDSAMKTTQHATSIFELAAKTTGMHL